MQALKPTRLFQGALPVFASTQVSRSNRDMSSATLLRALKRAAVLLGLSPRHFSLVSMRKTAATHAVGSSSEHVVRAIMGHRNIATTYAHYVDLSWPYDAGALAEGAAEQAVEAGYSVAARNRVTEGVNPFMLAGTAAVQVSALGRREIGSA